MTFFNYRALLNHVHDGDTINVDIDLGFGVWLKGQSMRLFGIDAPELNTAAGKAAWKFLHEKLFAVSEVTLVTTKVQEDKFGRILATIFYKGENVNQAMVDAGHAKPYFGGKKDVAEVQPRVPEAGVQK